MARKRILVIDDDADLRHMVEVRFSAAGFEVLGAGSGAEGLELARRARPAAIILDVNMPGIDGFETCRRLRREERTADIPVAILTTCTRIGELEEGLQAGADTYLTKPFDGPELVAEVREMAAGGRRRRRAPGRAEPGRDQAAGEIIRALAAAPRKLGEVACAAPGVLLGRQDDRLVADSRVGDEYRSILFEEDVQPFQAAAPRKYFKFTPGIARAMAPNAAIFDEPKKVLLRRTVPPLIAALDEERRLADKAVICVAPRPARAKAEFLLGVLASRLGAFAFERVIPRARGGALPWASAAEIERLPLPGPGGLAGRDYEDSVAALSSEIVRRARLGPGWRAGSAAVLVEQLDALVAQGFGLSPALINIVSRP